MKPFPTNQIRPHAARSAFTLPEILVTSTIFVTFIVLGMVSLQLFGIRAYQLSATKLTASADSLRTLSQFRDQIRGAAALQVGSFTSNTSAFVAVADGTSQIGKAVQVFPSIATNSYIVFYLNSVNTNLYMYSIDANGNKTTTLLARWLLNTNCFDAEDQNGTVLTKANQNDAAIHMILQFYEKEYVFAGNPTNYYSLETRTTPRAPNVINN